MIRSLPLGNLCTSRDCRWSPVKDPTRRSTHPLLDCIRPGVQEHHGQGVFLPFLKAICTGTPTKAIAFDTIRKCNEPAGSYDKSIAVLDDYLESFDTGKESEVIVLSNDCIVDSPGSRIKVYIDTLVKAKDMFHLRGSPSRPAVTVGLKAVGDLWRHLFGLSSQIRNPIARRFWPTSTSVSLYSR